MRRHNLDIRRRKRKVITTDSRHWMHKYDNLIQRADYKPARTALGSDITYIRMSGVAQWGYLSLIIPMPIREDYGLLFFS